MLWPRIMGMFIAVVPNRKSRPTILLRETYREGGKVRNRNLANLTDWTLEMIAVLSSALDSAKSGNLGTGMAELLSVVPHGHAHSVLEVMQRLGVEQVLLSRRCRERDLAIAMLMAQVINPGSKLSTHRAFEHTMLGEAIKVADAKAEELYKAPDWLLALTEKDLKEIQDSVNRKARPLRGRDQVGLRVGAVFNQFNMGRFFDVTITDQRFVFHHKEWQIHEDTALDGFYVILVSLKKQVMDLPEAVMAYKELAKVETAFKHMKAEALETRPIYHRLVDRVRAHVILRMLAYCVERSLRWDLAPLLFGEGNPKLVEAQRKSPVEPAKPFAPTRAKRDRKRTADGFVVNNFRDHLAALSTLPLCNSKTKGSNLPPFRRYAQPAPARSAPSTSWSSVHRRRPTIDLPRGNLEPKRGFAVQ